LIQKLHVLLDSLSIYTDIANTLPHFGLYMSDTLQKIKLRI